MGNENTTKGLQEPIEQQPKPRDRQRAVAAFLPQIQGWLTAGVPVIRLLEEARSDPDHPSQGSERGVYTSVHKLRRARQVPAREGALREDRDAWRVLAGRLG